MKRILFICGICLFGVIAYIGWDLYSYATIPADKAGHSRRVVINTGQSVGSVAVHLSELKIITSPRRFKWVARLKGVARRLQAGEYSLSAAMTPNQILDAISQGKSVLRKLTVPEGYTIAQIGELVEQAGIAPRDEFVKAAMDAELARKMGLEAKTFEGYLFPDTYFFSKDTAPEVIIDTMVKHFWSVFKDEWQSRAQALGFTVHQIVTLASIIEKETGEPSERPIISSVFHNRLKKHMRLESDPTVIYGMSDYNGNIKKKHLREWTPYNTYRIRGLPPGPIANPGLESLKSALFPAKTRYLYFVSKKDRTHQFSTNISDHNRAVRKYQLSRRSRRSHRK